MSRFFIAAGALAIGACAPSHQMLHQSSAYFELCHSGDFDPEVQPTERRACWAAWVEHYRRGQPSDRVAYAQARIAEIDRGGDQTQSLGETGSVTASLIRPVTASTDVGTDAPGVRDASIELRATPLPPVEALCGPRFEACVARCDGRGRGCRDACKLEERTCLRACF